MSSPQERYKTNCTVKDNLLCLGEYIKGTIIILLLSINTSCYMYLLIHIFIIVLIVFQLSMSL